MFAGDGRPGFVNDCMQRWHAGHENEKVGFDYAPVDCGGVVVCTEAVSKANGTESMCESYYKGSYR